MFRFVRAVPVIALFLALFLLTTGGKVEARPNTPCWAGTTGSYRMVCAYEYCYYSYPDSECYCYRYSFWLSQSFDEKGKAVLDSDLAGCKIRQFVIGKKKLIITAICPDGNEIKIEFSFLCGSKKSSCLTHQGGNVEFTKNNEPYVGCSMASYGGYESSLSPRDEGNNQEESPQTISSLIRQLASTE